MTTRKYSSRSQQTTLTAAISSSDTSIQVYSASTLIPSITIGTTETFTIVIDPDTALEEIVDVSNWSSGNTLTIARGVDGSSAVSHAAGAAIRHMVTGRDLREANTHAENTTSVHGLTLANVVKTTDTGTVTGTMIANNTIVDADINSSAAITKTKIAGTAITAADTGTVTNAMLAGSIAGTKNQLVTVATGSLSGTSVSISVPTTYRRLFVFVTGWSSTLSTALNMRINNDSGANYLINGSNGVASGSFNIGPTLAAASISYASAIIELADQTTISKMISSSNSGVTDVRYIGTSAVSSIQLIANAGTFDAGTYEVYGQ